MIYFEEIHSYVVYCGSIKKDPIPELRKNKEIYNVFKIYYKYMRASSGRKTKARRFLNSLINLIFRVYTTLLYIMIFYASIKANKVSVLILVYLILFFRYFIKINNSFLNYLKNEQILKIIEFKLSYFYEKFVSKSALKHQTNIYDRIRGEELEKDIHPKYTNVEVRRFVKENLFLMSLQLRIKITEFEENNKDIIFWSSLLISAIIINMTYFSGLVKFFPWMSTAQRTSYLDNYNIFAKIFGVSYSDGEECICTN